MRFFLISFLIFFMAVLPACKNEDDNYAGVGKLIAERNKMRYRLAEESEKDARKKELSTNVLDEKKIIIVDTASGTPLGQGIAYVNKKGEIVKIKLVNE
ncbi:hypothetical protein [Desulfobacter vibrioformis]|uniref:hypothetical protein n=1 Tax=Desulfobacter vibrioformis TaxID=34031 RepID=UPI00054EF269|nr:hypothetical protein [Desulfobacter vibrioformis]